MRIFFLLVFITIHSSVNSQDLMSLLDSEPKNSQIVSVFKDSRIINAQSTKLSHKGELKFLIQHRFGTINQGLYSLWGIDDAQVRFGFEYGLKDNITLSFGRSSYKKEFRILLVNIITWKMQVNNYFIPQLAYTINS